MSSFYKNRILNSYSYANKAVIPALVAGIYLFFLQHRPRLQLFRACSATACRLRYTGTAPSQLAITCLLSGQYGSQGRSRCYWRRSSSCSPPRSGRCCGTSCRRSNSGTRRCRNPSTIPLRYRSCRISRSRSAFSALLDVFCFRCCRNISPLHRYYSCRCT